MTDSSTTSLKNSLGKFGEYFAEFRRHLIHVLIVFVVLFLLLAPFAAEIYHVIAMPLQQKLPIQSHMIATDITATFVAPIKLVFFICLILLFPFVFYKIYAFLKTAMFVRERTFFYIFFPASIFLFYGGIALGYFFILPSVLGFFISMSPDSVIPMTDIHQYLIFCIKFFFILGLIFQIPLLIMLLIYLGLVRIETLKSKRAYIFILCFFTAMFITPPDVLSMAIGGSMIYLLFEIGLIFAQFISKPAYKK